MKTRLPFSTISFNTPAFLAEKLNELRRAKILSEWFYITHKPEDDEAGKREHQHVYMIPSKQVQTDDIRAELKEYDPANPEKPRGTLIFKSSKFGNWYLYAIHDPDYLASKGETRRYHYRYEDIVASDPDVLRELVYEIDVVAELGQFKGMQDAKKRGLSFQQYFNQGKIPPQQIRAMQTAWEMIMVNETNRGKHLAHAVQNEAGDWINPATGEIMPSEAFQKSTEKPQKRPTSSEDPTWCGATRNEWAELYESATSDTKVIDLDPKAVRFGKNPPIKETQDHAMD